MSDESDAEDLAEWHYAKWQYAAALPKDDATRIVEAILRDLNDRRGVKDAFRNIDHHTRCELLMDNIAAVRAILDKS